MEERGWKEQDKEAAVQGGGQGCSRASCLLLQARQPARPQGPRAGQEPSRPLANGL